MIDSQHVFNNRYRLDTKLGEGGMATVFCATDTLLRRRVAVKVLREQYATDQEFVRRFYQEAESAARLSHPNIVNTYDVGREGETYYIVMELVDGPSLAEIIAGDGKLPEPVAIDYAAQICNGLAYAHRQGLLHRDIKPANILVTKDDVVKLSDFGIARAVSQQTMAMTRPGLVMGSVYYLSPEQAQGLELQEPSDLYSVGVVLYQMLTGTLPYTGESPVTVALKHISDPVPAIDGEALGVSPAIAAIVNKLLQKQPENRFQSASEVASALREARERPAYAAFAHRDDAPTAPMRTLAPQPPPRSSHSPDWRASDEREIPRRRRSPLGILLLLGFLVAAAASYFAANNPFAAVPRVTLQNFTGLTDAQAQIAIANAGLQLRPIVRESSTTVAPNRVIRSDPAAGSRVPKGAAITLVVSSGKPTVTLQDVIGYTAHDAQTDLNGDKLAVRVVERYDPSAQDTVIDEKPKPGSKLTQDATVTLVVSKGPAPVKMPQLKGLTLIKARALAAADGFTVNISETAAIPNVPANVIDYQDIAAGTTIPSNHSTTVNVVVSSGGGLSTVPNVIGGDLVSASQALKQAGFVAAIDYQIKPASTDNGQVINENPASGTPAEKGSPVHLQVSVPGEVPDTVGMTVDQAKMQLLDFGYQIGNLVPTTEGANGNVVRTEPEAGSSAPPGQVVNIYYNSADAHPPQP